jgi:hypothetical protein
MKLVKTQAQDSPAVRRVARTVYDCLLDDEWPSFDGIQDFGLESTKHYGALQYAVRYEGATVQDLDDALGCGPALIELIARSNPYNGVTFKTPWDSIMVPIKKWASVTESRFPLGRLFATPEVLKLVTQEEIALGIQRHARGDWGVGDKEVNYAALERGDELLSCYRASSGREFYVRTCDERWQKLALLESELEF